VDGINAKRPANRPASMDVEAGGARDARKTQRIRSVRPLGATA
jgi:hypothetical protein